VHVGATVICPHSGQVTDMPSNTRVLVSGQPVATVADQFLVVGCPFTIGPSPAPCLTVQWTSPATRVTVLGQPAVLQSSVGMTTGPAPGPPTVVSCQTRVVGT
jgi:hypothetical protein